MNFVEQLNTVSKKDIEVILSYPKEFQFSEKFEISKNEIGLQLKDASLLPFHKDSYQSFDSLLVDPNAEYLLKYLPDEYEEITMNRIKLRYFKDLGLLYDEDDKIFTQDTTQMGSLIIRIHNQSKIKDMEEN